MDLQIVKYTDSLESKWDNFVNKESVNGTFLQTRNFLNYHPIGRFEDSSILIMNGPNIVAVIPASRKNIDGKLTFCSHMGSTFGGMVLSRSAYNVSNLEKIFPLLDRFLIDEGYQKVIMKATSDIFSDKRMALLDYEFFRYGYNQYNEIAFFLKCNNLPEDGMSMMSASRRRDYKYSLKNDFRIECLKTDEQVKEFYMILEENLKKFDTVPVHSVEELLDFKNHRLSDLVRFYGVFEENRLVAGTMLFDFNHKVLHTQYLACLPEYNSKFAMNYMDYNLIMIAKNEGFDIFSFGTSTGNHGKELNLGLALYKEGFGCDYSVNRTYYKMV
ncbi:MAG: GNAT family N-acetyltransferase [Lachnospiraceae bacterium]|nr:GNAT family N-acetyltransferase [Lachnospiraceae bacterium]